ncbi:MAG: long-chain-fatty-acid--CoA ligase [Ideonella sp.]|nr:long-chain-fatty-acid--CoA ligase [Ideonella sp.]MCC7459531.1 long-chain-fatty-acid--CoA ligase [Nitrospira sp.]
MPTWREIRSLADIPRFHARHTPDRTALVVAGRSVTFAELDARSSAVAQALLGERMAAGARIAWLGLNSERSFEMLFGCAKARCVFCPINWRLAPAEIEQIVDDAGAELLFVGKRFADVAAALAAPRLRKVIVIDDDGDAHERYLDWRDRHAGADPPGGAAADDAAIQIYTSGTTGRAKGVVLSAGALLSTGSEDAGEMAWNGWRADDVGLLTMPCFHIAGLRWGIMGLWPGACTVVMPEFSAAGVVEAIARRRVTRLFLAPTAIRMVLDAAGKRSGDFSSLRLVWYGASPMPPELLRDAMDTLRCAFVQTYGMTETGAQATYLPPSDHVAGGARLASAGKALPGVRLRVVGGDGAELAAGAVGEICVRSPSNMLGYWRRDDETRAVLRDGWMHTGDAGYLDADGYLFIRDRIKDMIVSGGENVYSVEVENALAGHPAVAEAAVIGVPDPIWGEAVKAVVVLAPGSTASADELIAHVRQRIAAYKAPKSIDFAAALPRSSLGKVLKGSLREGYWHGRDRQVN